MQTADAINAGSKLKGKSGVSKGTTSKKKVFEYNGPNEQQ